MPLVVGAYLGGYEIVGALGAGGMGEVYRARDTKLGRDVAIKVLPGAFAQDPDRVARFQREAQLLAALNHPNIGAIYGLEESEGTRFLVLELVHGESLAERLRQSSGFRAISSGGFKGPALHLDEELRIARQIVDALEAAHDKGIIHRDLKPSNIMLTADGQVKVLDFGLAKALGPVSGPAEAGHYDPSASPGISQSPTLTLGGTQIGVILGTAAYMAPEQAKGRPADKRSDVWAFGCVLYEMLTGQRAFTGEDVSDTLAAVLRGEPDWSVLPSEVPSNIRTLVKRCLEKDRKKRIGDVSTVRYVMDETTEPSVGPIVAAPTAARSGGLTIGIAVAAAAAAAVLTWALTRPAPSTPKTIRFSIPAPEDAVFPTPSVLRDLAISPDGTHVAYLTGVTAALGAVWVRNLSQVASVQLRGVSNTQSGPFFSPDTKWIGVAMGTELKRVAISGGPPITICPINGQLRGAGWGSDDTIVFATADTATGLLSVPAGGGAPKILTKPDPQQNEADHVLPSVLPDGHTVLFTITTGAGPDNSQIAVLDQSTGDRKILIRGASHAEYVELPAPSRSGFIVYAASGGLQAVRFDPARMEVTGDPVPVVDNVSTKLSGAAQFSISKDGALVYVEGSAQSAARRSLIWVTRQGREEPINIPPRAYFVPRLSPDGTMVALDIRDQQNDIWILNLVHEILSPLTIDPADDVFPVWTLDGKRIVFSSTRSGLNNLYWQAADGTGTADRLTMSKSNQLGLSITPDGTRLIVRETIAGVSPDLRVLQLSRPTPTPEGQPQAAPLLQGAYVEDNGIVSPDGHWIAYESNESSESQIYVRPFPDVGGGRWQISADGGTKPLWAPNGRELFYLDAGGYLTAVPVQTSPTFSRGNPTKLLNTRYFASQVRNYDVSRDGQKFLMIKEPPPTDNKTSASAPGTMTVVVNWIEELKAKTGGK